MSARLHAPDITVVTGATGWLGTALLHALTGDGPWARPGRVRAVVHSAYEVLIAHRISPQIDVVVADITRSDSLGQVFCDLGSEQFGGFVFHRAFES